MLKNSNLNYTAQNHSSVMILKHFVYRCKMNITAEFELGSIKLRFHNVRIRVRVRVRVRS